MKIRDVMTKDAMLCNPNDPIRKAAQLMKECDCGIVPVTDGDRLVGMLTDRDIAVRCIAEGKGADCKVGEAMTREVKYCFEDEDIGHVAENMGEIQVRRLPVMDRNKRLVGIVSLADLTREQPDTAQALYNVVQPGGQHSQSLHAQSRPVV